jgi:hypothetical protein
MRFFGADFCTVKIRQKNEKTDLYIIANGFIPFGTELKEII